MAALSLFGPRRRMSSTMQTPRTQSDCMLRILQGIFAVWLNHRPESKMRISVGRTPTSALFFKSSTALPNLKPGLRSKALWVLLGNSTFHSNSWVTESNGGRPQTWLTLCSVFKTKQNIEMTPDLARLKFIEAANNNSKRW